jgi:lipopolysaccharide export system protein LptA
MRHLLILPVLALCLASTLMAQTNAPSAPSPASLLSGIQLDTLDIHSREFEFASNVFVYSGNVQVSAASGGITCESLTGRLRAGGSQSIGRGFESIIAETNVFMAFTNAGKVCTNQGVVCTNLGMVFIGTASRMEYTSTITDAGTNEVIELSGLPKPVIQMIDYSFSKPLTNTFEGAIIRCDLTSGTIRAIQPDSRLSLKSLSAPSSTNAPGSAVSTNSPVPVPPDAVSTNNSAPPQAPAPLTGPATNPAAKPVEPRP